MGYTQPDREHWEVAYRPDTDDGDYPWTCSSRLDSEEDAFGYARVVLAQGCMVDTPFGLGEVKDGAALEVVIFKGVTSYEEVPLHQALDA